MRDVITVDVSDFSRFNPGRRAPVWWGIIGLILIEASVIAGFIATYFYLRLMSDQWPPPGVSPPELFWPTLSLVLLLISCVAMWWSGKAISSNKNAQFVACVFTAVTLATLVLVIRWQQFQELDFRWDDHAYGSVVWTLSGFHFVHVVSAVVGTAVVGILGLIGYFSPKQQIGVIVDTLYWNFVALAWIPLYLVLYWVPRWL
jgi:cytochrome c oxidase subunit 3